MRYLLPLIFLTGCFQDPHYNWQPVTDSMVRFHAGDKVIINGGFYNGCIGSIISYERYYNAADKEGVRYNGDFVCQGTSVKLYSTDNDFSPYKENK